MLFAYLVLHRKRLVRREELVDALWPEQSPASPESALRTLVSRLRTALGEGIVVGRSELTLELPADASVDLESATEGIKRAERALEQSSWEEAMSAAEDALSAAYGGFLPRVEAHWAEDERRRLDELCLRALECLAACGLGLGGAQLSATERAARRLIEAAPYRETGYRYLIEALAARGRVAEALQVFDGLRRLLQEELGVPPSAGLRSLHERLLNETGLEWRSERDDPLAVRPAALNAAGSAPPPLALPSAFLAPAREFVGRDEDLERLWGVYRQASSGTCRVAFLRGEAGIGKTRLATELALRAHAAGAVVLYGRCDEEPLLPHQPFVEALQHYVATCPVPELREQVSASSGELRRLVPELAQRLPDLAQPMSGDPEGERYRLFEAVAALLRRVGESRPVVLVLDDLHWADKPTLLLLRHLTRHARSTALVVVGTYRDTGVAPGHPLIETLADIGREHRGDRVTLGALDMAAVTVLVRAHAGRQAPELVRWLLEETDGNPLFIVEMLRHLAESGAFEGTPGRQTADLWLGEVGIPEGVKDVIGRRIARLGESTRRVLTIASVSGRDFELAVLERASELGQDELVEALEEAARAGVIEEVGGVAGRYTFTHSLIRETIYGGLSALRRALYHRRVAVSLEATYADEPDAHSAELAHHFRQAGSPSDLEKAIAHGELAGDSAVAQLAYEHAAAHYRQAVSLIDAVELPRRQAQRCDLVIAQGVAERQAGDPAYRETLFEGARLAHELGDAERLARAALANNRGFASSLAGVDGERVALLDTALSACGPHDSAVRASLLAQLAVELIADPDWRRRAQLSDEALAIARRIDDPSTLARTLNDRYVALWGPQTLPERLVNSREAVSLAEPLEDPLISFQAARFGSHAAMEDGELALADRLLERAHELADQLGQPILHWYFAVTRAKRSSIAGSLAEAEQLARDAFAVGQRARQPDAALWLVIQLFVIRLLRGTLASAMASPIQPGGIWTPDSGVAARPSRSVPLLLEAMQVATACETGRSQHVRERFDALMKDELRDLPYDWMALVIPCLASVACVRLRDLPRAQTLYAMLEPYAEQFVDSGPSWFGATNHHLANLATTLGRYEEADAHFIDATHAYTTLGAEAWLIRARREWARMLIARRTGRDMHRAQELLRNVLAAAQNNGLTDLESATASLRRFCP
ncbi:MAG TPA: AAA family ATPase [Solirubrobacteraceae bacterium]|nr:AAA family ATPase [Solirubrobacteraceae bacterium]